MVVGPVLASRRKNGVGALRPLRHFSLFYPSRPKIEICPVGRPEKEVAVASRIRAPPRAPHSAFCSQTMRVTVFAAGRGYEDDDDEEEGANRGTVAACGAAETSIIAAWRRINGQP